jgi:hypothetical protein
MARRRLTAALLALLISTVPAGAQSVTAPALKAAFLYNFAKFTEWPVTALAPRQKLALCVLGDNVVADALERTIASRMVDDHELSVEIIKLDGSTRSCQLLYVSGLDSAQTSQLLAALKGAAIFTVSDRDRFAEMGGVAQLIFENDRMRFAINVGAANRTKIKISSKLLALAQIVKDEHDVQY